MDEVYKNKDSQCYFETDEGQLPPHSNCYYIANETHNSNPRLIRSSLTKIPADTSILSTSSLSMGLTVTPFAELNSNEKPIPVVEAPNGIFRCKRCQAYINLKFKIDFNNLNKRVAKCNICGYANEMDTSNPGIKPEYFSSVSECPELSSPTVDFIAPNAITKEILPFEPHYLFMIDVSSISLEYGVPNYVSIFNKNRL